MDPTRKQIDQEGVIYTFRLPTARDMIQMDLKARELRQGINDGIGFAFTYSQGVAMLSQLCESPAQVDFEGLPAHIMDRLSEEVSTWVNSFRNPVEGEQGAVGQG